MLVLTRRMGEVVRIGDAVTVIILRISDAQVRLGIDAPKEVPVHREEIYQRIRDEVVPDPRPSGKPGTRSLRSRVNR